MRRRRVVRVPASSANLGPGFDAMAAAVGLWLELEVVETGAFEVVTSLDVPTDRSNLLVRAFERLAPADAFRFVVRSEIPLSGGLGSSAAAIVAGLAAADHLFELDADLLALATELEGHPDNVGAALHGGFVICDGPDVRRIPAPDELEAVLVVPFEAVPTADGSRGAARACPDRRRGRQRRERRDADARAGDIRLGPDLRRSARPAAPALPGPPIPALGGALGPRP